VSPRTDRLARTWSDPPGLRGFLTTVDHKRIAARYIVVTMALLVLDGLVAVDMRLQLAFPGLQRLQACSSPSQACSGCRRRATTRPSACTARG
jgi:hypothetical protein